MGVKTFLEHSGFALIGDDRDIMVSNQLIAEVIQWCEQMGIQAEQVDTSPIMQWCFRVNLWRVRDEQHRMLFALRWA